MNDGHLSSTPLTSVPGTRFVKVHKEGRPVVDRLAIEEPLEIRLNNQPLAVLMRTPDTRPQSDLDLVAGFLAGEGVIDGEDDLRSLEHCQDPNRIRSENIVLVQLASGLSNAAKRFSDAQRKLIVNGSCGVCGAATIEHVLRHVDPLPRQLELAPQLIQELPSKLRSEQRAFEVTGGLHGAALFELDGTPLAVAEDIGRHNAVDKVIGRMLRTGRFPLEHCVLVVSSRASYELVQKAITARISVMITVGSASSLAHDLAMAAGLTLYSFVRGDRFNEHKP